MLTTCEVIISVTSGKYIIIDKKIYDRYQPYIKYRIIEKKDCKVVRERKKNEIKIVLGVTNVPAIRLISFT